MSWSFISSYQSVGKKLSPKPPQNHFRIFKLILFFNPTTGHSCCQKVHILNYQNLHIVAYRLQWSTGCCWITNECFKNRSNRKWRADFSFPEWRNRLLWRWQTYNVEMKTAYNKVHNQWRGSVQIWSLVFQIAFGFVGQWCASNSRHCLCTNVVGKPLWTD